MHQDYPHPTAALLSYGDPRKLRNPQNPHGWPDYVKGFSLSLEHLPHLVRMLKDSLRYEADSEDPRVWANLHTWRAIGQLCGKDAVYDLLDPIDNEEDEDQDDWAMEEIPVVLAKMGPSLFLVLSEFINDMTKSCSSVSAVSRSLVALQEEHPELREQCITSLSSRLTHFRENDPTLNGLLISSLADLKAIESVDLI